MKFNRSFFLLFISITAFANSKVDEMSFVTNYVAKDLIRYMDSPNHSEVRAGFFDLIGMNYGHNLPEDWIANAKKYFSEVNHKLQRMPSKSSATRLKNKLLNELNMNDVRELKELTSFEFRNLSKRGLLDAKNYEKAIKIVNERRAFERQFIKKVQQVAFNIANTAVNDVPSGMPAELGRAIKARMKMEGSSTPLSKKNLQKLPGLYQELKQKKMVELEGLMGEKEFNKLSTKTRDVLFHLFYDGHIDPSDTASLKELDLRNIPGEKVLDTFNSISPREVEVQKEFVKYILTDGSSSQYKFLLRNPESGDIVNAVSGTIDFDRKIELMKEARCR